MHLLATTVIESLGNDPKGNYFTRSYILGEDAQESGSFHKVTEIKITDDFGFAHAEIALEGFGKIWISNMIKIVFRDTFPVITENKE